MHCSFMNRNLHITIQGVQFQMVTFLYQNNWLQFSSGEKTHSIEATFKIQIFVHLITLTLVTLLGRKVSIILHRFHSSEEMHRHHI